MDKIDIPFKNYAFSSLAISFLVIVFAITVHGKLPPQIPIFYGLPEGEEQLTSSWGLAIPAMISLAITLINIPLSIFLEDEFLRKILAAASLGATLFAAITTLKIAFLIGNF